MWKAASLLLAVGTAACDGRRQAPVVACAARPADFRSFAEAGWYGTRLPVEALLPNRIGIASDGRPTWNDAPLGAAGNTSGWSVLDRYLEAGAQLEPAPPAALVFPRGVPCAAVERARGLIRRHLSCGPSGQCFQGLPR